MKSLFLAAGVVAALSLASVGPSLAQGSQQTLMKLDVNVVATGYRASKILGASVTNDANDDIGKIDDLIVTRSGDVPYAILSVGGFLGMGDKLVAVNMASLQITGNRVVFPGATKDALKALPEFKYAK